MSNSWGMLSIINKIERRILTKPLSVGQVSLWPRCLTASTVGSAIWPTYLKLRLRYVGCIGTRHWRWKEWERNHWHLLKASYAPPPILLNTISSTYRLSPLTNVAYALSCPGCTIVVSVAQGPWSRRYTTPTLPRNIPTIRQRYKFFYSVVFYQWSFIQRFSHNARALLNLRFPVRRETWFSCSSGSSQTNVTESVQRGPLLVPIP